MSIISTPASVSIPKEKLAELCQRFHIRKLALFGSVLREDFHPDSDIDVLVEFETGYTPGFAFIDIQDQLSDLLGRPIDLNTLQDLSCYFRESVLAEAESIYVQV
ncbi:MAG: nucleotidyltransferase family protein [Synechococcus sp.]